MNEQNHAGAIVEAVAENLAEEAPKPGGLPDVLPSPEEVFADDGRALDPATLVDLDRLFVLPRSANLVERLAWVQRQIDYVGKTGVSADGYNFRTIDGVLAALHNPFGRAGVLVTPQVVEFYERPWTGYQLWKTLHGQDGDLIKSDPAARSLAGIEFANPNRLVRLSIRYEFRCPTGETLSMDAVGEGIDNSDKAVGKAYSYAFKAAMSQMFTIPTADPAMDNETASTAQDRDAPAPTPWWEALGWTSERQAIETRAGLVDRSRKFPPVTLEALRRWMAVQTTKAGPNAPAQPLYDSKKRRIAGTIDFDLAVAWSDRLDELAQAAEDEAAGKEPFFDDANEAEAEKPDDTAVLTTGDVPAAETENHPSDDSETVRTAVYRFLVEHSGTPQTVSRIIGGTGLTREQVGPAVDRLLNDSAIESRRVGRTNVYVVDVEAIVADEDGPKPLASGLADAVPTPEESPEAEG